MKDMNEKNYFYELLIKAYEGQLSPDDAKILNDRIKSDPQAAYLYAEFFDTVSGLVDGNEEIFSFEGNDSTKLDVWLNCLAHAEKEAPAVEITAPEEPKILIQEVRRQKAVRKFRKGSLFTLFAAAAAIVLIFVFAHFAPPATGFKVAVLSDSINAKWADMDVTMQKGTPILTSQGKLFLREGYAELLFDNNARFAIEGPVEFQILTDDQIKLNYGRLYGTVPQEAIGFTVNTPSARIIDLGTEFGVEAAASGDTYLHVIKGKTTLIAGHKSNKVSMEVGRGNAKKVSASTSAISDITLGQELFVRDINSSRQVVWRGEPLDLSSIIAGENGFTPSFNNRTLNPNTGNYETKPLMSIVEKTNYSYNRVSGNVFIDGVFIPDGSKGFVTITSQGHRFDCPATSGKVNRNIAVFYKPYDKTFTDVRPASFDGITYGTDERPCVLLHSNIGITIDLDRIREAYPDLNIEQLQTGYGLQWLESTNGKVDFFVLVDGILKHEDKGFISQATLRSRSVTIPLEPDARFLTFIVTDKQESSAPPVAEAYFCDVFFLLNPRLILQ